jgi:hypothetical protein
MIHAQLDSTVTIGLIVAGIVFVIGLGIAILFMWFRFWMQSISAVILTLLVTGVTIFLVLFPFGYAYNNYVPISGNVQSLTTRFISDGGGGTTQYYLVYLNGNPYKCNDTRCANLKKGGGVTLLCEKQFQFNTPNQGYLCNWGKLGLNG